MAKLIITDANGKQRELPLSGERLSIGRHADNDLRLDDRAVSSHHAVIVVMLRDAFLEDLDSTNGTLVNGQQIVRHRLNDGETITIGRNQLRYMAEIAPAQEAADRTQVLRPSEVQALIGKAAHVTSPAQTAAQAVPQVVAPQRGAPLPIPAKVRVTTGLSAGREVELTKVVTMLGKPGVQVAAITRRPDGYYIQSIGNPTPPRVNGEALGVQAQRLNNRDLIELAGNQMTFLVAAAG